MDKPDENVLLKILISIGAVIAGFATAWKRLMRPMNGHARTAQKPFSIIAFESEIMSVLNRMRVEYERGFRDIDDHNRDLLRRIQNHDDRLYEMEQRIIRLERQ